MDTAFFPPAFRYSPLPFGPGVRPRAERRAAAEEREAASAPAETGRGGAALRIAGVSKRFGDKRVLSGIDLAVTPGEFVAIVGRSGCGKSTLLRLALGLDRPDEGSVAIGEAGEKGGAVEKGEAATARFVFQEARLLPWERVAGNVVLGVPRGKARAERLALADEVLSEVGLAGRGKDWPSTLSGGQRQRVALARALVSRPRFLALDEPLGALDALTRIEMQGLVERVWRRERFTAVLVTHDVSEAVALADRVLVMEDGRFAHEERVDLPRPRRHGDAQAATIERRILDRILSTPSGW